MADKKFMVDCFLCGRAFQFGPHRYEGKHVAAWGLSVCDACVKSNWDGIVPASELVARLSAKGITYTTNERGWIEWPR